MNMNLLAVLSTGFVVIVLSKYAEAVLWPTIHIEGRTGSCNVGTTCADGFYCAGGECLKCSPCPDLNTYHKNQLTVFQDCLRQGLCPRVCSPMYLPLHQQANQSFCLYLRSPGCKIRSCDNEGTLDMQACRCLCSANWNGTTCSECGLSCLNGGTLDDSDCQCRCDKDWAGRNCSECGLSCLNGGTLDVPDCQCRCDKDWTGQDCSDCGLRFCLNGGTLNPTSCQCLCSEGWTGHKCSESQTEGGNSPTQTNVDGGEPFPLYVFGIIGGGILAVVATWCIAKKFGCSLKSTSPSLDVERDGLIECYLEVSGITQQSISVKAKNPSQKFNGKKMKFSCRKKDSSRDPFQKWSSARTWNIDVVLQHTFEELLPGVTYVISLHQHRHVQHAVRTQDATTYFPLSVDVSGTSATISGLNQLGINAVQVCPCLMLPRCKNWINISPEQNELVISDIPPGIEYCVKAGIVDSEQLPSRQKFRCIAEGKLHVDVQEITQDQRTSTCMTFEEALKSVDLKKSLQVEFDSTRDNPHLPEMVAQALGLDGDDRRIITGASSEHVEKLDQILTSRDNDTQVHGLIERLLLVEQRSDTEMRPRKEAEVFLIKVVGHTWTHFHCLECIRRLHQEHSV